MPGPHRNKLKDQPDQMIPLKMTGGYCEHILSHSEFALSSKKKPYEEKKISLCSFRC